MKLSTLTILFLSACFIVFSTPSQIRAAETNSLDEYLSFFYNRYSLHLDANGLKYSAPGYGIKTPKQAESAREIISLASYYKYRARHNDQKAIKIIKKAIEASNKKFSSIKTVSLSFEDATARFLVWQLLEESFLDYPETEKTAIRQNIIKRASECIAAKDTSNRAALSAGYWQAIVNSAFEKKLLDDTQKNDLNNKILTKIEKVRKKDVDKSGWYHEGPEMKFNPHYHLVTAVSFLGYGELTNNATYINLAKKMIDNLRQVSFSNGMVEARLGGRPVGLGAQFYLGAGLISMHFKKDDYGTYLNYAYGNRFFSDPKFPNRLEYHATRISEKPNYHDDYAFSNIAEFALALPSFETDTSIKFSQKLKLSTKKVATISNTGKTIVFRDIKVEQKNNGSTTVKKNTKLALAR